MWGIERIRMGLFVWWRYVRVAQCDTFWPVIYPGADPEASDKSVVVACTVHYAEHMDTWSIRNARTTDYDAFIAANAQIWGQKIGAGELAEAKELFDYATIYLANRKTHPDQVDATFAHYRGAIALPGASHLESDFVTWVGARPDARRQGGLAALMGHYSAHAVERQVGWSVLWASEPTIYGRFGYGLACTVTRATFTSGQFADAAKPHLDGTTFDIYPADETSIGILHQLWEKHAEHQLGVPRWPSQAHTLSATIRNDSGSEKLDCAVAIVRRDGEPVAAALIDREAKWENDSPAGEMRAMLAVDVSARDRIVLAHHLTSFDLFTTTHYGRLAPHDVLIWAAGGLAKSGVRAIEGLWMRPIHPDIALASRTYRAPASLTLKVSDALEGVCDSFDFNVCATGEATCEPSRRSPDLVLDSATIGALSFGGFSAHEVQNRVIAGNLTVTENTPGSLQALVSAARSDNNISPLVVF